MKDRILCERNGIRQYFTRRSWDVLGTDKLGWVEVPVEPPTPKEVVPIARQPLGRNSMPGNGEQMEADAPQPTTRKPRKR